MDEDLKLGLWSDENNHQYLRLWDVGDREDLLHGVGNSLKEKYFSSASLLKVEI